MFVKRRLITNTAKSKVTELDGKYIINGIPITVDGATMNNILYPADENEKGMPSMVGKPMSLTHPEDSEGRNVSIFSPEGIDFYSGGKVTQVYNKDGTWYANASIDKKKLKSSDEGEYFANRLDSGLPIGVSTGLTFTANNESGDGYDMVARNMEFDHLAMLHESERPAGGDDTVMRFNGVDVEVCNFDDFVVNAQPEDKTESIINRALTAFANKLGISYNSQEFENQPNEGSIMNRDEMLEALGLATNSQVTDDELKTLMKSKLAANASEGFTKEDVELIVNAAIKPLADQLTANANKELDQVAEQVAALNKGLDADDAKALGLDKCKAFLAANSAEYVADGYTGPQGRTTASNKKDDGFDSVDLNAGLEE